MSSRPSTRSSTEAQVRHVTVWQLHDPIRLRRPFNLALRHGEALQASCADSDSRMGMNEIPCAVVTEPDGTKPKAS